MGKQPGFIDKVLSKLVKKQKLTPSDLKKYEVLIVGNNLGGMLTKNIEHFNKGESSIFIATDTVDKRQHYPLRNLFETKLVDKKALDYTTSQTLAKSCAKSEGKRVTKLMPKENAVELENGRRVEYDQLVLATGYEEDYESVPGLMDALKDTNVPVLSPKDFSGDVDKRLQSIELYEHGDAYFYIPPFPFSGEVENYNFLYALQIWKNGVETGTVSPVRSTTIVNANSQFCQNSQVLNEFITKELEKFDVNVLYNTKLVGVDKDNRKLVLENEQGKQEKSFNNLYTQQITKSSNDLFKDTQLSKDGIHVDVDPYTLRSNSFNNVFALGDCANLNIQKSLYAGLYQMNVVRANVLFQLQGQQPTAQYKGTTKIYLAHDFNNASIYKADYKEEKIDNSMGYLKMNQYMGIGKKLKKVIEGKGHGTEGRKWPTWGDNTTTKKKETAQQIFIFTQYRNYNKLYMLIKSVQKIIFIFKFHSHVKQNQF